LDELEELEAEEAEAELNNEHINDILEGKTTAPQVNVPS
jgi:hypothetical protein